MARESRARATSKALGGRGIFAVSHHKGDGGGAREIPLKVFRDVGRPPREVPRHVRGTGAAGGAKGDGISPESVSLAPRRGKNRRLREVPRHLQGRCATDSTEGDKSGQKSLAVPGLGGFRGVRARNPWQCQRSVAPLPRTPDASCPSRRRGGHHGPPWRSLFAKNSSAFCRTMRTAP